MPDNQIKYTNTEICDQNPIFQTEDEMRQSLSMLCYGDLYIIGRIWIEALKSGLLGSKWSLIPVVQAAKLPPAPEKPPPMKYKDLPVYTSPHYEYKDYIEDLQKCPKRNVKLMQEYLLPHVRSFRQSFQQNCCEFKCELKGMKNEICCALNQKKVRFKNYMRDPENLVLRQVVVGLGGLVGYYVASSRGIPSRLFSTGLGLLAAGALCFPKETDEAFRTFTYHTGKSAIAVYNFYCSKTFTLRERLPCPDELPPPPVYRKPNPCPKK